MFSRTRGDQGRKGRQSWFLAACVVFGSEDAAHAGLPEAIVLQDVTAESDIRFPVSIGDRAKHDLTEILGGGVALIDGDSDGKPDLVFGNGRAPWRYYRNLGNWTFADETVQAALKAPERPMGMAVGDFDGDGRDDLFLTGWRDQRLYRNRGGGTFEDVTDRAGLRSRLWTSSAAWADLDGDGDLDLYVVGYLDFDADHAPFCAAPDGQRDYCGPEDFPAEPDRLYRNDGDGRFTEVSREAGIDLPEGRGLGVVVADLTGDGRLDLFVANDGTPCWLFENLGGLRFREIGHEAGVAVDGQGDPLAGMGAAVGDVDGDGLSDLLVTNFFGRATIAFHARGKGRFVDASAADGLKAATRRVNGFGLALVDLDGDGWLDLAQTNGHVLDRERLGIPFAMRPTLLQNRGGTFKNGAEGSEPWSARSVLGRGLAVGDLNGDGRPDLVINANGSPPSVLKNASRGRSVAIELEAGRTRRTPFGARLKVTIEGRALIRDLPGGGSYLSASERKVYVGLGKARQVDRVEVVWPGGESESWTNLPASNGIRLIAGTGRP